MLAGRLAEDAIARVEAAAAADRDRGRAGDGRDLHPSRRRRHQHDGQRRLRRRRLLRRHRRGVSPWRVWRWLGRVPFAATAREQERLREQVLRGDGPETLLLCEHEPVVTLGPLGEAGARAGAGGRARAARRRRACRVARRRRHLPRPGQLVGYPIVRLRGGVIGHVTAMARAIAGVLAELGIDARWRRETPGLWVRATACREDLRLRRARPPPRRDPRLRAQRLAARWTASISSFPAVSPRRGRRRSPRALAVGSTGAAAARARIARRGARSGRELGVPPSNRDDSSANHRRLKCQNGSLE